jgi:hypothetical protein
MTATTLTFAASTVGYPLPSGCLDVYRVWNQTNSSTQKWKELLSFDVAQEMATSEFVNGIALILGEGGIPGPMRVLYKAAFTEPTSESSDMQTTVGLQGFMLDVPVWYAVSVLVPPDEVLRSEVGRAVSAQRSEQVAASQNVRTAEYFRARYEQSVKEAEDRLEQLYPTRIRIVR